MERLADTALTVFSDQLEQIRATLAFLDKASAAKLSAPAVINWGGPPSEVDAVRELIASQSYPRQLLWNACYISSVAAFEEFVASALGAAMVGKAEHVQTFGDLGDGFSRLHMRATGSLLRRADNPPAQYRGLSFDDVCKKLGTCYPESTVFKLNTEAVCLEMDLLTLDRPVKLLMGLDFIAGWDDLGDVQALQKVFNLEGKTRDTSKALREYLAAMSEQRHRIAHTGSASDVSLQSLEEHLNVIQCIAESISARLVL